MVNFQCHFVDRVKPTLMKSQMGSRAESRTGMPWCLSQLIVPLSCHSPGAAGLFFDALNCGVKAADGYYKLWPIEQGCIFSHNLLWVTTFVLIHSNPIQCNSVNMVPRHAPLFRQVASERMSKLAEQPVPTSPFHLLISPIDPNPRFGHVPCPTLHQSRRQHRELSMTRTTHMTALMG